MSVERVRKQFPPPVGLAVRLGDPLCGLLPALDAVDRVDDGRLGQARITLQARQGAPGLLEDFEAEVHALKGNQFDYRVNRKMPSAGHRFGYHSAMADAMTAPDPWIKRPRFRELCDEWLRNHPGATKNDLAHELNLADDRSLKQYYSGKKPLSKKLLYNCMAIFRVEAAELVDDPLAPIGGIAADELTHQGKMWLSMIYNRFKDPDLTDEDREEIYNEVRRFCDRIKSFKARIGKVN